MSNEFQGFSGPFENWFKFPLEIINCLPELDKKQIVLLVYLFRHTWGYHDDDPKKITLDEFQHGRKRRDQSRIDRGTGLARNSIIDGLAALEKRGFIEIETDDQDKARIEKWYSIRMCKNCTPEIQILHSGGAKIARRTEKDTTVLETIDIDDDPPDTKKGTHPLRKRVKNGHNPYLAKIARFWSGVEYADWSKADRTAEAFRFNAFFSKGGAMELLYDELGGFTPEQLEQALRRWCALNPQTPLSQRPRETKLYSHIAPLIKEIVAKSKVSPRGDKVSGPRDDCPRCEGKGWYRAQDGNDYTCNCEESSK